MRFLLVIASMVLGLMARADQCEWNDRAIAQRGSNLIKKLAGINNEKPSVYTICEPCNKTEINRIYLEEDNSTVSGLDVHFENPSSSNREKYRAYWQVILNKNSNSPTSVDLAYIYVKTAKGVYANVAQLVNCPVVGVTPIIYTDKTMD